MPVDACEMQVIKCETPRTWPATDFERWCCASTFAVLLVLVLHLSRNFVYRYRTTAGVELGSISGRSELARQRSHFLILQSPGQNIRPRGAQIGLERPRCHPQFGDRPFGPLIMGGNLPAFEVSKKPARYRSGVSLRDCKAANDTWHAVRAGRYDQLL